MMNKSDIKNTADVFSYYIGLAPEFSVTEALEKFTDLSEMLLPGQWEAIGETTYAPGKWTVKEVLQHLIDMERVFTYRALRFSRNDQTPLPGIDEQAIALYADANKRNVDDLLAEYALVRQNTKAFFGSLDEKMLQRYGKASGNQLSVLALGFLISGHLVHHFNIIRERYLPLLGKS